MLAQHGDAVRRGGNGPNSFVSLARVIGEQGGSQFVTLIQSEMPSHAHSFNVTTTVGTVTVSNANILANAQTGNPVSGITAGRYYSAGAQSQTLNPLELTLTGGSLPHNNLMPYLTLNFCIAMQGVFPPRG